MNPRGAYRRDRDRVRAPRSVRLALVLCGLATVVPSVAPAPVAAAFDSSGNASGPTRPAAQAPSFPQPMALPPSASVSLPPNPSTAQPGTASHAPHASSSPTPTDTWTPFSHSHRNSNGSTTVDVHLDPTYRQSNGRWTTIDPSVHATGRPAQPLAAENALWPVRFGASGSDMMELELDKGPVILSSADLSVGQPSSSQDGATYANVASGADLSYRVTSSGVTEELVLNSPSAPRSFTFHLADPSKQLGTVSRAPDGGYVFSTVFDGAVQIEIPPAFAYQPVSGVRPLVHDASSAHLSVVPAGNGFDITESVDGAWLAGKSFPVILDPTFWLNDAYGLYGLSVYVANGCGGCNTIFTQNNPMGVGAFDYGGSTGDYWPMRSHFYWNLAPYIPLYSAVSSASFNGYVTGCFEDQPADFHCNANTYYEELHGITQGWNAGATYDYMNAITNPGAFSGLTQGPFCISYQPYGCNYVPNGCGGCFWQGIDMTAVTQGWVSNPSSNYGITAMLHEPVPYNIGGPTWDYLQSSPPPTGNHPFLAVTFDPAPGAPGTPTAVAGNGQATVSWGASSTNGGSAISQYVVQAWSGGTFISNTSVCGSCTTATVTGLTNGTPYYFSVYAVDADGMRSPNSPNSNIVTPTAIQLSKRVVQTAPYTAANPQPFFSRGEVVTYQLTVTNPMPISSTVSSVTDNLPAGLAGIGGNLLLNGSACSVCSLSSNQFSLTSPVTLAPNAADVFIYEAVALGASDRLCSIVNNAASVVGSFGATANASAPITVCDSGLGYENWWSYVNQDLGAGGKASVNVANGNLVVQVTDSTPVQAHGRFAYVLRRTYNSQDTSNVLSVLPPTVYSLPDAAPIGAGWRLNVDQLGDGIVDGAVANGLLVPSVQGLATAPFDVTLVDEDGTHHVFTPNGLAANGIPVLGGGITPAADLLDLVPRALIRTATSDNVCVDETFTSPAGVHLALWRYLEVNPTSSNAPCTPASGTTPVVMGFAAMRPDRLRFEFSGDGHLVDATDGAGVDMRYAYRFQPTPTVALGNLLAVYEPRSCTATVDSVHNSVSLTPGCRALVFSYPLATETDIIDPGGRTTQYLRNSSNQLLEVKNVQAGTAYQYTYSTQSSNCGSSYGQLCSASDLNLPTSNTTSPCATTSAPQHITCFGYTAPASGLGLPQLTTLTERRGYSTTFTYTHGTTVNACGTTSSDYVTADRSGERQRLECIDPAGSVGEIDQGTTGDTYQRQTLNFWDTGGQGTCVQPAPTTDHNLCRSFRYTLNGAWTAEDTSYTFNPEGQQLVKAQCFQASDPGANGTPNQYPPAACARTASVTTAGYQAEYTMGDGSQPAPVTDTVAGNGAVTSGAHPTGHAGTLYVLSDKTQSLTPNGNAAGSNYPYYETTYVVDNNQAATPNATVTATECAPATSVNGFPCATNPATSGPVQSSFCPGTSTNSGLVCETDFPGRTTRYEYDSFGQKVAMVTPNAVATSQGHGNAAPPGYMYVYFPDSQRDLSGAVSAGGWLQAVADPTGNFVADAYDEAGNQTRTWDRNATQGHTIAQFPGTASSPPTTQYAETLHATGSTPYTNPWRYVLSQRDPRGYLTAFTVDANGNQLTTRPPYGTLTNSSAYDITQQFDLADELTSHLLPEEASGNHATFYSYDAFGNKATMTSPNGVVTAYQYDSVNRLTTTAWTRAAWPSDTATVPSACRQSTTNDAPIPAGLILCFTRSSYDGTDNRTASGDGNAQVTSYLFDSLHRVAQTVGPRQVNGAGTITAKTYDADGNVIWSCSPREFTDPGHTNCAGANPYSTRRFYTTLDQVYEATTFRVVNGVTQAHTTAYAYDADGNQVSVTDPNGHTTTTQYDLLDRKTLQTVPRDASSSNVTQWFYDAVGNLTTLDQPDGPSTGSGADGALVVDGSTNGPGNPYVIPPGKNYTNVTLQNGAAVSVSPYDGSGDGSGMVQITATGTVSICQGCAITVAGQGPAGGTGGLPGARNCGLTCDGPTNGSPGAGVGGGGGGAAASSEGGPGGGGGHAAAGAPGAVPPYNPSTASVIAGPGSGGSAYGNAAMAPGDVSLTGMGSGGGGGGGNGYTVPVCYACAAGGKGGAGGGLVRIVANSITVGGQIDASGAAGQSTQNGTTPAPGPGGGGSGGSIWLSAEAVTVQPSALLQASGGQGGQGTITQLQGTTVGGNGSDGYVRIDSAVFNNNGGSIVGQTYQSLYHRYTDYSYDADNHLVDTVQGADNPVAAQAGLASPDGGQNVRTRSLYDPEGHVYEQFEPRAFTTSVTNPDPSYMVRTDYNYDERPVYFWVPRYDTSAHSDLGLSSTQSSQCPTGANPQSYPSNVGLCVTRIAYDPNGNVTFRLLPTSNGSDNRWVIYSYTNDNLVGAVTAPNPASNGNQETAQTNVYDGDGKLVRRTDALGLQQVTAYTPDELVQQVTNQASGALTHVTSFSYDANGNQVGATDGVGHVTTTAYYSDNLRSDSTDGAGDHTSYQYDANGNATTVTSPSANAGDADNTAHAPTTNTYTFDNLLQTTTVPYTPSDSQAYATSYAYDDGGRKTSQHELLLNTTNQSVVNDGGTQSFTYYNDDRLQQQTGRDGSTIQTQYDPAGNVVSTGSGGSNITASYYLDDLTRTVNDGSQTSQFTYDGLGTVAARAQVPNGGGTTYTTAYTYGDAELPTSMTSNAVQSGSTSYTYDQDGRALTQTMPNGEQLSRVFNPDNTLQQQTLSSAASGGTTLAQYTYAYNADYLITQQEFSGQGANGGTPYNQTLCYGYDDANRVNNAFTEPASQACPTTPPAANVSWDHDGNRLSYTPIGTSQPVNFTYNANNSIASSSAGASTYTFAYNGAAETTNDGCLAYTFDGFDRVTQANPTGGQGCGGVTQASYTYDAFDRRASQTDTATGTTNLHYDGRSTTVAQESTTNYGTVAYELDPRSVARGLTSNQGVEYLAGDGHGSLTTATTTTPSVACTVRLDPFGAPLNPISEANGCNTGVTPDDLLFKGTRRDADSGQYQFGSRVYDPTKATFLTPDSYRTGTPKVNPSVGTDPLTANTYVGLNGDPINLSDPSGHIPCAGEGPSGCSWPEGRGPVHSTCDETCQNSHAAAPSAGACSDGSSYWTSRCANADELDPSYRTAYTLEFFSQYQGTGQGGDLGLGGGVLDFEGWLIRSGRVDPQTGSRWWRITDGLLILDMHEAQIDVSKGKTSDSNPGVQGWINYIKATQAPGSNTETLQHALWSAHQTSLHNASQVDLGDYTREAYANPSEGRFMNDVVRNVDRAAIHNLCTWRAPLCSGLLSSATMSVYPQTYPADAVSVTQEETEAGLGNGLLGLTDTDNIGIFSTRWRSAF